MVKKESSEYIAVLKMSTLFFSSLYTFLSRQNWFQVFRELSTSLHQDTHVPFFELKRESEERKLQLDWATRTIPVSMWAAIISSRSGTELLH